MASRINPIDYTPSNVFERRSTMIWEQMCSYVRRNSIMFKHIIYAAFLLAPFIYTVCVCASASEYRKATTYVNLILDTLVRAEHIFNGDMSTCKLIHIPLLSESLCVNWFHWRLLKSHGGWAGKWMGCLARAGERLAWQGNKPTKTSAWDEGYRWRIGTEGQHHLLYQPSEGWERSNRASECKLHQSHATLRLSSCCSTVRSDSAKSLNTVLKHL